MYYCCYTALVYCTTSIVIISPVQSVAAAVYGRTEKRGAKKGCMRESQGNVLFAVVVHCRGGRVLILLVLGPSVMITRAFDANRNTGPAGRSCDCIILHTCA